jgi:cysteine sulfinate desulfinase/cysteine desulfurase-like protein
MGVPMARAISALRFTVGPENTPEEIDELLSILPGIVATSRSKAPAVLSPE